MKKCCSCKQEKFLNEFWKNKSQKDGLHKECKICMKKYASIYRKRESTKEWYKNYLKSKNGNKIRKNICNKYYINNKNKFYARGKFLKFIKKNNIKKPIYCQNCNIISSKLEAHHENYSEWLNVKWLCIKCHKEITFKKLNEERNNLCIQ